MTEVISLAESDELEREMTDRFCTRIDSMELDEEFEQWFEGLAEAVSLLGPYPEGLTTEELHQHLNSLSITDLVIMRWVLSRPFIPIKAAELATILRIEESEIETRITAVLRTLRDKRSHATPSAAAPLAEMTEELSTPVAGESAKLRLDELDEVIDSLDKISSGLLRWACGLPDEGETSAEVAKRLGIQEDEIESRIDAAIAELRARQATSG